MKYIIFIFIVSFIGIGVQKASAFTDKFVYAQGEKVVFAMPTSTPHATIVLKDLSVKQEPVLAEIKSQPFSWNIPSSFPPRAVGVYLKDGKRLSFISYFRVITPGMLTTFEIEKQDYKGLDIFSLNGGMSAEYAVQKALTNLSGGVSHTWLTGPGGGPRPVWGTPDFLQSSIRRTVDLYNNYLGDSREFETVIISTGVPTVPYLSAAMNAPVLPLHFLVSVNSTKEVSAILEHSSQSGVPCYATLGYDASMTGVGVVWIKLLDLPAEYRKFIIDHKVKNVIIAGVGEDGKGESFCRKLKETGIQGKEYADGSLYILYTESGSKRDIETISTNIVDYDPQNLDEGSHLADWESGVVNSQIDNFTASVLASTSAQPYSLMATHNMMVMYNLATDMAMNYIHKNKANGVPSVQGVYLNEYLISQPMYELSTGNIPLLYWQFVPPVSTIHRMGSDVQKAVDAYEPGVSLRDKPVHINARIGKKELEHNLKQKGFRYITKRTDGVEEIWDLSDGFNAPCEEVAQDIVGRIGVKVYRNTCRNASFINIEDLAKLSGRIEGLEFSAKSMRK